MEDYRATNRKKAAAHRARAKGKKKTALSHGIEIAAGSCRGP
jgi:hypothetical protein